MLLLLLMLMLLLLLLLMMLMLLVLLMLLLLLLLLLLPLLLLLCCWCVLTAAPVLEAPLLRFPNPICAAAGDITMLLLLPLSLLFTGNPSNS